jgi:hypothetical protein
VRSLNTGIGLVSLRARIGSGLVRPVLLEKLGYSMGHSVPLNLSVGVFSGGWVQTAYLLAYLFWGGGTLTGLLTAN